MILQFLYAQYDLLLNNGHEDLPLLGRSPAMVSFGLCLDNDGNLVDIMDLRVSGKNKMQPRTMLVPMQPPRAGQNAPAYYLCDKANYVLGYDEKLQKMLDNPPTEGDKLRDFKKLKKKVESAFMNFQKLHKEILGTDHPISRFLDQWQPHKIQNHPRFQSLLKDIKGNSNFVFYLEDEDVYAHEDNGIKDLTLKTPVDDEDSKGQCLVTGESDELSRIHNKIKGVYGSNAAGASIVGFNDEAFESYGKEQSYNAPVGKKAMFQYTTALNYMLADKAYHSPFGEITVVFWANKPGKYGDALKAVMPGFANNEEAAEYSNLIKDLILALKQGRPLKHDEYELDPMAEVYVLGLAPNNARLAIAFWEVNSFEFFLRRIADHIENLEIIDANNNLSSDRILWETLPQKGKDKKVPSTMAKSFALSIFTGGLYPMSLYQAIINRIRADGDVNAIRAAMVKAYLMRKYKMMNHKEVITVSLNESDPNVGYQLGRLFAVLEKLQKDALGPTINATIKDRYFASASASPATVFSQLLKLSMYHSAKAKSGGYWEKVKTDILDKIGTQFPQHLSLDDQGRFILGYYHQLRAIYTKKEED
ncbi:MAG TPA: type I-C CRISPR-associated protein Cas8c/Csd1 [Clostridiales bacterium]|nr:type I-C CRISPR-associated protein Cas8c/Csd1 [Clostridiales bacterium]